MTRCTVSQLAQEAGMIANIVRDWILADRVPFAAFD